jgi:hypothetical protein
MGAPRIGSAARRTGTKVTSAPAVSTRTSSSSEADDEVNDEVETAYRTKYQRYGASYVDPLLTPDARAATLELVPRSAAS